MYVQLWHYAAYLRRLGKGEGDATLGTYLKIVGEANAMKDRGYDMLQTDKLARYPSAPLISKMMLGPEDSVTCLEEDPVEFERVRPNGARGGGERTRLGMAALQAVATRITRMRAALCVCACVPPSRAGAGRAGSSRSIC